MKKPSGLQHKMWLNARAEFVNNTKSDMECQTINERIYWKERAKWQINLMNSIMTSL